MAAVVLQLGRTFPEISLVSFTSHLIPEDGAVSATEGGVARGSHGVAALELAAHDVGVGNVPAIVAHRPPRPILLQLHPALTATPAARQPESSGTWEMHQEGSPGIVPESQKVDVTVSLTLPHSRGVTEVFPVGVLRGSVVSVETVGRKSRGMRG